MVISLRAYLAILGVLAAERLLELVLSARNSRQALAMGGIEIDRGHYPFIVASHTLFFISAAGEAIFLIRPFPEFLGWTALMCALLAQALRYWSIGTLGSRWTTRIVVLPNSPPVKRGPYRFIRHPNYLAVVIEIACVPLIRGCFLTASIFSAVNGFLLRRRIAVEEAALGATYGDLFGGTPRLVPAMTGRLKRLRSLIPSRLSRKPGGF